MMKVGFRLVGLENGFPKAVYFETQLEDEMDVAAQRAALRHVRENCPVRGLGVGLQGGEGMVTLRASDDQLSSEVVTDIRKSVDAALASLLK